MQESLQIRQSEEDKQNYITQHVNVSKNSLEEEMNKNENEEMADKSMQPSKSDTIIENPINTA